MDSSFFPVIFQFITPILLGIIAFWLIRFVKKVDSLEELLRKMEVTISTQNATIVEKHKGFNARLLVHDRSIEDLQHLTSSHTTEIEILKEKII